MSIDYVSKEQMALDPSKEFDSVELLSGTYSGGVRVYRCNLKSGCSIKPETIPQTLQVLCLTDGKGAITTPNQAFSFNEVSFYIADPESEFSIHAATDVSYTMFVVEQKPGDLERYSAFHMKLPAMIPLSKSTEYCQDCKSANTRSFSIIPTKRLCRVLMGVVEIDGTGSTEPEGCVEKGHPAVAQWNVLFGETDLKVTIDGESIIQHGGDVSYVTAGLDHSLECMPGKKAHYIWFEHYVLEKDYLVSYPQPQN